MNDLSDAIKNTIAISLFNKGLAGKIFEEVKTTGPKVVMKNNTAECVLMSPEEYIQLMDEVNDARLLKMTVERMEGAETSTLVPAEDLYKELGISAKDIKNCGEVEIELA